MDREIPMKTTDVARSLGRTYWQLYSLIRLGKLTGLRRDGSGDYVWFAEDIAAARAILDEQIQTPFSGRVEDSFQTK